MDLYQRDGVEGIRERVDALVVVTGSTVSTARIPGDLWVIGERTTIAFRFGERVLAVVGTANIFDATLVARKVNQAAGYHAWLDEVVPLYPNTEAEEG